MNSPHQEASRSSTAAAPSVDLTTASLASPKTGKGGPLFTAEEEKAWSKRFADWDRGYRQDKATWDDKEALEREKKHETRKRVFGRVEEFTNALLVIVGSRGKQALNFDAAFALSNDPRVIAEVAKHDTPENRRSLVTLLRALEAVPKSWAMSAFVRFLRNQGKQAQAKYAFPGKGMFGKEYGWRGDEISNVCKILMGGTYYGGSYSDMLITYGDVRDEIQRDDPNYEKDGTYAATFTAIKTERNKKLVDSICVVLDKRGLGAVPTPEIKEPKGPRVPKQFEPGTIIRKGTLRDLPLPALVKVPIDKSTEDNPFPKNWQRAEVEWVVTKLFNNGYFQCFRPGPVTPKAKDRVAFASGSFLGGERKEFLEGATYLGPWRGKLDREHCLNYKFRYKRPGEQY